jgi:hypothetical protein
MANFKLFLFLPVVFILGCSEQVPHFFSDMTLNDTKNFKYQDVHQLSLTLSNLTKKIDETGFSPVLKCAFHLENTKHGPWGQAWVAFNISVLVDNKEVIAINRADVLQNHIIDIEFQHELPKFGVKLKDIKIKIQPIAWMPSYPLNIIMSDQSAP